MKFTLREAQFYVSEKLLMLEKEDAAATERQFMLFVNGKRVAAGISVAHCVAKVAEMRVVSVEPEWDVINVRTDLCGRTFTLKWGPQVKEAFPGLVESDLEDTIATVCEEEDGVELLGPQDEQLAQDKLVELWEALSVPKYEQICVHNSFNLWEVVHVGGTLPKD